MEQSNEREYFSPGSALGVFHDCYSEAEKRLLLEIAGFLQQRESGRFGVPSRERKMHLYVRCAASLYELAKVLSERASMEQLAATRTMDDWLRIITGHQFYYLQAQSGQRTVDVERPL